MGNKYLDGSLLTQSGNAPTAPNAAPPSQQNKYLSGELLAQDSAAPSGPDKYHQRAAEVLDQLKAQHGGREVDGGAFNTYLHGATAGLGNRAAALLHAGIDQARAGDGMDRSWDSFKERLAYENALEDEKYRRASQGAGGTIGEIAGSFANPVNKLLAGSGVTGSVLGGAGLGAVQSYADNRTKDSAISGAETGGIGGGVGWGLGKVASVLANRYLPQGTVPDLDAIKQKAGGYETAFVNSDVEYNDAGAKQLQSAIQSTLEKNRYRPNTFREIADGDTLKTVNDFVRNAQRPFQAAPSERSVLDIRDLSRVLQREQGSVRDPNAARVLSELQGVVRDFPGSVNPSNVIKGDSQAAGAAWKAANNEYTKAFKTQSLRDAIAAANDRAIVTGSGGNADNAIRQNIKRLLDSRSDWTPDEIAGMRKIMGEGEDKMLRSASKMAPGGNGLMSALSWLGSIHNPLSATMPVAGAAAKHLTQAEQETAINNLDRLMRVGGDAANVPGPGLAQRTINSAVPKLRGPFAQIFTSLLNPAPVRTR